MSCESDVKDLLYRISNLKGVVKVEKLCLKGDVMIKNEDAVKTPYIAKSEALRRVVRLICMIDRFKKPCSRRRSYMLELEKLVDHYKVTYGDVVSVPDMRNAILFTKLVIF
jgi:hypothetical protein